MTIEEIKDLKISVQVDIEIYDNRSQTVYYTQENFKEIKTISDLSSSFKWKQTVEQYWVDYIDFNYGKGYSQNIEKNSIGQFNYINFSFAPRDTIKWSLFDEETDETISKQELTIHFLEQSMNFNRVPFVFAALSISLTKHESHMQPTTLSEILDSTLINSPKSYRNNLASFDHEYELVWNGLQFRSKSEIEIAKELDKRGILFFPNAGSRITDMKDKRLTKEVDFLVIHNGKLGILECDGKKYHTNKKKDIDRDNLFKRQGIHLIKRYPSNACYTNAKKVIDEFLGLFDNV